MYFVITLIIAIQFEISKEYPDVIMWILYAFASAFFAGITAILAKCGIQDIDSNVMWLLQSEPL